MNNWSLENELCKLAATNECHDALVKLELIGRSVVDYQLIDDGQWTRGGSETYIYPFGIDQSGQKTRYLIKACVALNVEGTLEQWIWRRNLLASNGISTPKLFYYGKGVLIEEFIPFEVKPVLLSTEISLKKRLLSELAYIAGVLTKLGFATINIFDDLRSHGNDVVVIDFGQDLGDPINPSIKNDLFEELHVWLKQTRIDVEKHDLEYMEVFFSLPFSEIN